MERNEFSSENATAGQPVQDFSNTTSATQTTTDTNASTHGFTDRARELAGTAQEKLADVGSTVRERAGTMKDSLADALTTGADKLRHRGATGGTTGPLAGATTAGGVAVDANAQVTHVSDRVANGMTATADWLRDADLDGLRTSIEGQVKQHPGRTLLIAVGLGYLIGKSIRK